VTTYSHNPAEGQHIRISDVREFLARCEFEGIPETAYVKARAAMEIDFIHGPRAVQLTAVTEEPDDDGPGVLDVLASMQGNRAQRRSKDASRFRNPKGTRR